MPHPNLSVLRRQVERRVRVQVRPVHDDLLVPQQLARDLSPAVLGRQVERHVAVVVAVVDVGAFEQQVVDDVGAAVLGGDQQDGVAWERSRGWNVQLFFDIETDIGCVLSKQVIVSKVWTYLYGTKWA